ncbi:MAG TPA: DUF1501 domain-containing protein [Fimbriimonadales bacterium]|nr:DUF1501 domain-containing protein [Fimbriimonadales bacterium]
MANELTRRDFLKSGAIVAIGVVTPPWLAKIAKADILVQSKGGKIDPDNILVVCQLSGGNDGLNTVIPWSNANYYSLRPTLGLKEESVLKVNEALGFHPAMNAFKELFVAGSVAVIQNVGYPNPDRSHFKSMEIWQTANPDGRETYGWLGKYLDHQMSKGSTNPVLALSLSRQRPTALKGKVASVPCFASLADISAFVGDPDSEKLLRDVQGMESGKETATDVVRKANLTALDAMSELDRALDKYQSNFQYGNDEFGQGFKQIAHLIAVSPKTRVFYLAAGGFDTHSQQPLQHERLLKGFSDALNTFMQEMKALGKDKKVTVMVFSEFGRRCAENASLGTDHGAAAPMFVAGGRVKGGFVGENPDLVNLDRGDLKWKIDFRQVYSTLIDRWMGGDSESLFGKKFEHVPIL